MTLYAYDIYSGFIEDTINVIGSRDMPLVERYQRLGEFSQHALGLPAAYLEGWEAGLEQLIMSPPAQLTTTAQAVAFLIIMRDAGQRRFRILTEGRQNDLFLPAFEHLNHAEFCGDFIHSQIARYHAPDDHFDWGFLDVRQIETLLIEAMGDESFKESKTAVIAGRLSHMPRADAEHALIDVGIDTQSSISHNIDYLILGSKGTGGTKYDKAQLLNEAGKEITILDEQGFDNLLRSPKRPPEIWSALQKDRFEDLVRSLRHVWAFGLDLYCLSFPYHPEDDSL